MAAQDYTGLGFDVGRLDAAPRVAPLASQAAADTARAAGQMAQGFSGLGAFGVGLGQMFDDAQQKTRFIEAQTKALTGFDELNKKYEHDADFGTVRERYGEESKKLAGDILSGARLDPQHAALLEKHLAELTIQSSGAIDKKAFSGEAAQNIANLNTADVGWQTRYLSAGSPAERASVLKQQADGWSLAVASGWANAEQGQRAIEVFRKQAQDGELMRLINSDPKKAIDALEIGHPHIGEANAKMNLTPQERALYERHLTNLNGPGGVNNPDGSRSTLFATTVNIDGKEYILPTVYDGKKLDVREAVNKAKEQGLDNFPSYANHEDAAERYNQLHQFMEKDTADFQSGKIARFTYLDPSLREARLAQARNQLDTRGQLEIGALALRRPEAAALTVGKASDPATVATIYDKGVIPQESGGRADAVSPVGALGVGQLMPDTARAAARRMGLADVAGLPDDALRQKLLSDKGLNRRLGLNEFSRLIDRFDGDVPAALAGYNAGEGNAKTPRAAAWREQAIARFGQNYTAEEFASIVPIKETRDYVLSVYARLGARADAHGLSETARKHAQTQVAAAVASEAAQTRQLYSRMASDAGTEDFMSDASGGESSLFIQASMTGDFKEQTPAMEGAYRPDSSQTRQLFGRMAANANSQNSFDDLMKGGFSVDPARISARRQIYTQAAMAGDANAEKLLRKLDYLEEAAPVMAAAFRMAPSQLSAQVLYEETRLANSDSSPADLRRLKVMQTALAAVRSRAASDPVGLAARAGAFRAEPLPVDRPTGPEFAQALSTRNFQALAAAEMYDGNLVPLRPQEASALKNWWETAKPDERIGLAAQFSAHLDPTAARAAIKQVAGDDRLSLVAGGVALRMPETARKIMQGVTLLDSGAVKPKIGDVRAALAETMKGQIYGAPRMQNDAVEAGLAVYAANRAGSGALFDAADRPGIQAAIEEVTGKITSINGAPTPIPPGVAPAAVRTALSGLTAEDFAPFGGLQKGMDPAHVGAHAQLHALELGGSAYMFTLGGLPVMDASNTRPLVVDLAALAKPKKLSFSSPADARASIDRAGLPALPRTPDEAAFFQTNPGGAP